jgi:hypothetical protein
VPERAHGSAVELTLRNKPVPRAFPDDTDRRRIMGAILLWLLGIPIPIIIILLLLWH